MSFSRFLQESSTNLANAYGVASDRTKFMDIRKHIAQVSVIIDDDASTSASKNVEVSEVEISDMDLSIMRNMLHYPDSRAVVYANRFCEKMGVNTSAAIQCLKYMKDNNKMPVPNRNSLSYEQMREILGVLRTLDKKYRSQ